MVTFLAVGLSLLAGTSIPQIDVPADAASTMTPVHWRMPGRTRNATKGETTKPEVDEAKQDKPRYTGCWQRKRTSGRWKRTYAC